MMHPEAGMDGLRLVTGEGLVPLAPCSRCQATGCPWDRIGGKIICPDCQEALALGNGPPLIEPVEKRRCTICQQFGTIRYLTYPLHSPRPVEMDLCGQHFQELMARRLERHAYGQLARQLNRLGVPVRQVFLLHDAFYDDHGKPLQPVPEVY